LPPAVHESCSPWLRATCSSLPLTIRYFATKTRILKVVCCDCAFIYYLTRVKGYQNSTAYGWTLLNVFIDRKSVDKALGVSRSGRQRFELELSGATAKTRATSSWAPFSVSLLGPYLLIWYGSVPDPEQVRVYDPKRNVFLEVKIHKPCRQLCEALLNPLAASSSRSGSKKTLILTTPTELISGIRFCKSVPRSNKITQILSRFWLVLSTLFRVVAVPILYLLGLLSGADVRLKAVLYLSHGPVEELVTNGYREAGEASGTTDAAEDGDLLFNSASQAPRQGGESLAINGRCRVDAPAALLSRPDAVDATDAGGVESTLLELRRDVSSLCQLVAQSLAGRTALSHPPPETASDTPPGGGDPQNRSPTLE